MGQALARRKKKAYAKSQSAKRAAGFNPRREKRFLQKTKKASFRKPLLLMGLS